MVRQLTVRRRLLVQESFSTGVEDSIEIGAMELGVG
jgi:hypothetical protein